MQLRRKLEFFFDYASPYSYLADQRLDGIRARTGCELVHRPMLLGGVFKATGNSSPAVEPVEAKRNYGMRELQRFAALCDAPFQMNPHSPVNSLGIMRGAYAALAADVFSTYHRTMFQAMWAKGEDLSDPAVCVKVLCGAGLEGEALLAATAEPTIKESLKQTTEEAVARGVFGAPSFFVGDEMFFGNDRVEFVEESLS